MKLTQVVLQVAHCCQMSDNPNGRPSSRLPELQGYGSGGNRCTEACNAEIDWTYKIGPMAIDPTKYPEDAMFQFTEMRNGGRDVSSPRNGQEVVDWVNSNGASKGVSMGGIAVSFASIKAMIDRRHTGMAGFSDYNKLQKASGGSPYSWHDPDGDGHVLMVVGYDDSNQWVCVNDSLIGDNYQPSWYTYASFVAAQFDSLSEVYGPALPLAGGSGTPVASGFLPDYFTANSDGSITCKQTGIKLWGEILAFYQSFSDPLKEFGLPTSGEQPLPNTSNGGVYREFELGDVWYDPGNLNDSRDTSNHSCYRGHVHRNGGQSAADAQQISELNKQVADLKTQVAQLEAGQGTVKADPATHQALVAARASIQQFIDAGAAIDAALKEV